MKRSPNVEACPPGPMSYASFVDLHGSVTLLPYRRLMLWMGRFFVAVAVFGVLPLAQALHDGEPILKFVLAYIITIVAGIMLLRGGRLERIVMDGMGIAVLPTGPRIPAAEIVSIREVPIATPPFGRLQNRSFRITLLRPRLIPLLGPAAAYGRTLGIAGADPSRPSTPPGLRIPAPGSRPSPAPLEAPAPAAP